MHIAAHVGDFDTVRLLLEFNANVHAVNRDRITALHIAADGGHADMLELLIAYGANVDATDDNG